MTMSSPRETARIYDFTKARAALRANRDGAKLAIDMRSRPAPATDFGSGWYHDAAIQGDQPRKL